MIKEFIITLYKVGYNREVQLKRGRPVLFGCLVTTMFAVFFMLQLLAIAETVFHTRIKVDYGKIVTSIIFAFFVYCMYLLLFKLFKVELPSDEKYPVSKEITRKMLIICIINLICFFIIPVLRDYILRNT